MNEIWLSNEEIGHVIADIMEQLEMTRQAQLAEAIGSPGAQANVSRWISGTRRPSYSTLHKIAALVGEDVGIFQRSGRVGGEEVTHHMSLSCHRFGEEGVQMGRALALLEADTESGRELSLAFRHRSEAVLRLVALLEREAVEGEVGEDLREDLHRRVSLRRRKDEPTPPHEPSPTEVEPDQER